jgi:hypothetical protein
LSADNPDIWRSNRPAQGGETGAMFEKIIARTLEMRSGRSEGSGAGRSRRSTPVKRKATPARKKSARKAR